MFEFFDNLAANLAFLFERLTWLSLVDILLVSAVFFMVLLFLRGTQATTLLRGILLLIVLVGLLTSLEVLPAFSWLMRTALPALLFSIPVIFAPEIRHALERLGRAGVSRPDGRTAKGMQDTIGDIVSATVRLAERRHGALIILRRRDRLEDYIQTGVRMDANITPELLMQVFYPNTPLHDGAVILAGRALVAAACVLPLSSSGVLTHMADRQMGLRHRAALGITEVSDAVAVVVSEETGSISVVHGGKMIRRLDPERLENILRAFFKPAVQRGLFGSLRRMISGIETRESEEEQL
jgi:diadenylate cyclase